MLLTYTVIGIAIFVVLYNYVRQVILLFLEIEDTRRRKLWPERWLLIAFMPFLGAYIYKHTLSSFDSSLDFNLAIKRKGGLKPVLYLNTKWVLFQEQYDRKTSMHHGTELKFLNIKTHYQFISSKLKTLPLNTLYVEVARNSKDDMVWATLMYQPPNWKLTNLKVDVVIPIIKDVDKAKLVYPCRPSDAYILNGGESFIVGLSEYQILRLPHLCLRWTDGEISSWKLIDAQPISWPFLDAYHDGKLDRSWTIENNIMVVYQKIQYTSVVSIEPVVLQPGDKVAIMPGDKFKLLDAEYMFWIDYKRA